MRYRRACKEPGLQQHVNEVRHDMVRRAAGLLTAAGIVSIKTFTVLQESAQSESVRLAAARAIVEFGYKLREAVEVQERLAALEEKAAEYDALLEKTKRSGNAA